MKALTGPIFIFLFFFPIAALAADVPSLNAAAGFATDSFTLILKIGVPSGLISGLITLLVAYWNNKAAQKNNREKIAAEAENISRQLNQRQHEFEIQTKMQIESLHSEEKKKVCWDFLVSVKPSLFVKKQFNQERMEECIQPLYLYCQDNHFSYFNNLSRFIYLRDLSLLCDTHETICKQQKDISAEIKRYENVPETRKIFEGVPYKIETCHKEMDKLQRQKEVMETIMNLYGQHYEKALEAAKKLIWNEPIEKAQPLQLEDLPDEDDI